MRASVPVVTAQARRRTLALRIWLAQHFRVRFSGLYSALDTAVAVPVQIAAYKLATDICLRERDSVLDVGFGLGYGLAMMAQKTGRVAGIETDRRAVAHVRKAFGPSTAIELKHYDGYSIPYPVCSFDVVTCIDVLEHVHDYGRMLNGLCRVARRTVFISTPNQRPEYTRPDGMPQNPWHLREWTFEQLDDILRRLGQRYEWYFLNGPWEGPFSVSCELTETTMALVPVLTISTQA